MSEFLDIVNENGLPTGRIVERSVAHMEGIWHRTSHVWLVRRKEEAVQVLLQKRTAVKSFPGCYDISSAGHIPLGVSAKPEELICCGDRTIIWDDVFFGKEYHDRQYTRVFVLWKDIEEKDFCLQPEEVDSVRWIDLDQCILNVKENSFPHCIEMPELLMVRDVVTKNSG